MEFQTASLDCNFSRKNRRYYRENAISRESAQLPCDYPTARFACLPSIRSLPKQKGSDCSRDYTGNRVLHALNELFKFLQLHLPLRPQASLCVSLPRQRTRSLRFSHDLVHHQRLHWYTALGLYRARTSGNSEFDEDHDLLFDSKTDKIAL